MPTVTLVANPTSITAGGSSTLTVTASNAMQVTVSGSDGSSYNLPATGGVQAVSPTATTTYTANATGTGGKASAVTTVTVVAATPPPPAPTVTIAANPTSITAGGTSTLMVAATNATTVTIAGSDGSSYSLSPSGGDSGGNAGGIDNLHGHCQRGRRNGDCGRDSDGCGRSTASRADRHHYSGPHDSGHREWVYVDGGGHECRHRGRHGHGWQQLQPAGDRRHPGSDSGRDHNLHRYRNRHGRYGNRNRHGDGDTGRQHSID